MIANDEIKGEAPQIKGGCAVSDDAALAEQAITAGATVLCCQWCNRCSYHEPLRPGMKALICYCSHHRSCDYSHKRQYQCVCRKKPWEYKTQITRPHCRGVCHSVCESCIQVCSCVHCQCKGQGRSEHNNGSADGALANTRKRLRHQRTHSNIDAKQIVPLLPHPPHLEFSSTIVDRPTQTSSSSTSDSACSSASLCGGGNNTNNDSGSTSSMGSLLSNSNANHHYHSSSACPKNSDAQALAMRFVEHFPGFLVALLGKDLALTASPLVPSAALDFAQLILPNVTGSSSTSTSSSASSSTPTTIHCTAPLLTQCRHTAPPLLSPQPSVAWIRAGDTMTPVFSSPLPQSEHSVSIVRAAVGQQLELLDATLAHYPDRLTVAFRDISAAVNHGRFIVPQSLKTHELLVARIDCQPALYFAFQQSPPTPVASSYTSAPSSSASSSFHGGLSSQLDMDNHVLLDAFFSGDGNCSHSSTHCKHDECADIISTIDPSQHYWIAKSYEQSKRGRLLHVQEHFGASIPTQPRENDHVCTHCFSRDGYSNLDPLPLDLSEFRDGALLEEKPSRE